MKVRKIVSAVTAASLAFSSVAFAQSTGAQDQAQQRDDRGNLRVPGPNRIEQQGQLGGPTPGVGRGEEARAAQQREQARADQRNYRGDNRGFDNRRGEARGPDNRGFGNRGYENRSYDNRPGQARGFDNRGHDSRPSGYREGGWRGQGRGIGPSHSWYRGDRLPYEYRSRQYVVDDWRGHQLYAPPRGYQWVQSGGDYVLVAIATGIIAAILLNQ